VCIIAAALASPLMARAPVTPKKAREPIYSSLNFVDPEELKWNDIIPAIIDHTIEHQQFCPLSACMADITMRYTVNSVVSKLGNKAEPRGGGGSGSGGSGQGD
jgi:hypothetical protein